MNLADSAAVPGISTMYESNLLEETRIANSDVLYKMPGNGVNSSITLRISTDDISSKIIRILNQLEKFGIVLRGVIGTAEN